MQHAILRGGLQSIGEMSSPGLRQSKAKFLGGIGFERAAGLLEWSSALLVLSRVGSPIFTDPSGTVGAKATLNGSNNPAGSFVLISGSKEVVDPVNAVGPSVFTTKSWTVGESVGSFMVPSGRFDAESGWS